MHCGKMESASLLQDTVDQFEKVIDLERTLLRKSIRKHQRELEEVSTELAMKEEELGVWEQKVQQIQQDNEVKFCLAKARYDTAKVKGHNGRNATASVGLNCLGLIAEGEEDGIPEGDEEEEDEEDDGVMVRMSSCVAFPPEEDSDAAPMAMPEDALASGGAKAAAMEKSPAPPHPGVESVNALADILAGELGMLRRQWQELSVGADSLTGLARPTAAPTSASPTAAAGSTSLFNDPEKKGQTGRMTVEQRIDRLQRDIRTETDRILQERGTPSVAGRLPRASAPGTPSPSVSGAASAGGGSTPVMASSGSLATTAGSNLGSGREAVQLVAKPGSGLASPMQGQSVSALTSVAGYSTASNASDSSRMAIPGVRPSSEQLQSDSAASLNPGNGGSQHGSPAAAAKAPGFVGSVMRAVSPSVTQVARSRAPAFVPGRPVAGVGVAATAVRPGEPMQSSIGSSSGPPRWAVGPSGYSTQVPAPSTTSSPALIERGPGGPTSSPAPPVIGTGGLSLGSRGSAGSPSGGPRTTALQLNRR